MVNLNRRFLHHTGGGRVDAHSPPAGVFVPRQRQAPADRSADGQDMFGEAAIDLAPRTNHVESNEHTARVGTTGIVQHADGDGAVLAGRCRAWRLELK